MGPAARDHGLTARGRRTSLRLAGVALALLAAAGCGGRTTGSSQSSSSGGDAASILASIRTPASTGPSSIDMRFTLSVTGTPSDPQLSTFLSKPVTLTLHGPVDEAARKADVTFSAAAGPFNVDGTLRQSQDNAWLQFNGKWYALPAGSLSQTKGTTSSVDPTRLVTALGSPAALIRNAKVVGSENVGSVKTDHVTGDIDTNAVVAALARVSKAAGNVPLLTPSTLDSLRTWTHDVKSGTVDVYVGQDDKQLHRVALSLVADTDAATRSSTGIDAVKLSFDASTVPASSPDVKAPQGAEPLSQLQQDLAPLLPAGAVSRA
jgi:hypothetical protein